MKTEASTLVDGRYMSDKLDRAKSNIRRSLPAELTPSKKTSNNTAFNVLLVDAMHAEYLAYVEENYESDSEDLEEAELLVKMSLEYLAGTPIDLMRADVRYRDYLDESSVRNPHTFLSSIPALFPRILRQLDDERAAESKAYREKEFIEVHRQYHDLEDYIKSLYEEGRLTAAQTEVVLLTLGLVRLPAGVTPDQVEETKQIVVKDMVQRITNLRSKTGVSDDEKRALEAGTGFLKQSFGYPPELKRGGYTFDMLVGQIAHAYDDLDDAKKHVVVCLGSTLDELYPS